MSSLMGTDYDVMVIGGGSPGEHCADQIHLAALNALNRELTARVAEVAS